MTPVLSLLISLVLAWVMGAVILMIIGRLGLGLSVDGFGAAFVASAAITVVAGVIIWLLGLIGIIVGGPGLLAGLVTLVVSAIVLLVSDRFVKGMKVNGFGGAIIAAIAYGVITWLLNWVVNLIF
jgi:putative membrane protein